MFIVYLKGKTELLEESKENEVIKNGSPSCKNDLSRMDLRVWNTIFFVPIVRTKEFTPVYFCKKCNQKYDYAYRESFINIGRFSNMTNQELEEFINEFSLKILIAILREGKTINNKLDVTNYCNLYKLDNSLTEKIDSIAEDEDLVSEIINGYNIFRDIFNSQVKNMVFGRVAIFLQDNKIELNDNQYKIYYMLLKHWGFEKEDFDVNKSI